jgi:glycosyltransferase involved in cell wall biosynthesis
LFIGRLDPAKGSDLLPDLARTLWQTHNLILAVAGDGAGAAALTSRQQLAGPLRIMGFRHDAADLLFGADMLLLPSRLEGCPLVFLEAAARRCPVVATNAALECYGDAASSFAWIAPMNDVKALAHQATRVLQGGEDREARVSAAYDLVRRYDAASMQGSYMHLLRKLLT